MHKENITWKGNKVKQLSLNDFVCRFFLFFFYSGWPVDEQKADCTFDYIDVWKKNESR